MRYTAIHFKFLKSVITEKKKSIEIIKTDLAHSKINKIIKSFGIDYWSAYFTTFIETFFFFIRIE